MGTFSHQWFSSINEIDQAQWQRLFGDEPFTQHAFLYALEPVSYTHLTLPTICSV